MALAGALTFSELAARCPTLAAERHLKEGTARSWASVQWAYSRGQRGRPGALSVAFATYFGYFVPVGPAGAKAVAIGGLLALTAINVAGVKAGAFFSDVFTVLKLAGIAGLVAVGLTFGSSQTSSGSLSAATLPGGLGAGLAAAMVGVLWPRAAGSIPTPRRRSATPGGRPGDDAGTAAVTLITSRWRRVLFPTDPVRDGGVAPVAADAVSRAPGR